VVVVVLRAIGQRGVLTCVIVIGNERREGWGGVVPYESPP
jgi:hypothetical protein